MKTARTLAVLLALAFALATVGPAFAGGEAAKCNSGRGNGSETTPATDCDPGNSGGQNQGGD